MTLEFTIANLNESDETTDITFSDDLNLTLEGLTAVGLPLTDLCGTGSQLTGIHTLSFTAGALPPEGACTFSVTLQVPITASRREFT